mgnify:CR=1 FL=1
MNERTWLAGDSSGGDGDKLVEWCVGAGAGVAVGVCEDAEGAMELASARGAAVAEQGLAIDQSPGLDAELKEAGAQADDAARGRIGNCGHAGALEEAADGAHGGDGFGADGEWAIEVGADELAGEAAGAKAGIDDDAADDADVGVDGAEARGSSFAGAIDWGW